jgi:hypothetical protein
MTTELPIRDGYTIDERLEEFRKVTWKKGQPSMEIIPFDSPKGRKLYGKYFESYFNIVGIKKLGKVI